MYRAIVHYEGFDGNTVEETLYFHMSTKDWIKADEDKKEFGGYEKYLAMQLEVPELKDAQNVTADNIRPARVLDMLDDIISRSYGIRDSESNRFIKSAEATEMFMGSLAYDAFLDDLLYKEGMSEIFIKSMVPKGAPQPKQG